MRVKLTTCTFYISLFVLATSIVLFRLTLTTTDSAISFNMADIDYRLPTNVKVRSKTERRRSRGGRFSSSEGGIETE